MNALEARYALVRHIHTIRRAIHDIEAILGYYEKLAREEAREAVSSEKKAPSEESPDYPNGSA